ncbi:MAG: hypothetical protein M1833_002715 [Piccolia ochrophora]|nr:MAG: hypothetical protein M1833_002715 [Piccolia ochrophora]
MGPANMFFHSCDPVAVLQPHQAPHFTHSPFTKTASSPLSPWLPQRSIAPPSAKARGLKRSLDEMTAQDEALHAPSPVAEPQSQSAPLYGEGMTLMQPNGFSISAGSQTGTWAEELTDLPPQNSIPTQPGRITLHTRKSQRLDNLCNSPQSSSLPSDTLTAHSPPKASPSEPVVDEFTHRLGIGWTRLCDDDLHLQAAARGWARYIENHYPLSSVRLLLKSKGLNAYLASTDKGYFLFQDDLRQGQPLGLTEEAALTSLQRGPVAYETTEALVAVETPPGVQRIGTDDLVVETSGQEFTMELD